MPFETSLPRKPHSKVAWFFACGIISVLMYKSMSIHPDWATITKSSLPVNEGISIAVLVLTSFFTLVSSLRLIRRGTLSLYPLVLLLSLALLLFYNSLYSSVSAQTAAVNLYLCIAALVCAIAFVRDKERALYFLRFNTFVIAVFASLNSFIVLDLLNIIPLPFAMVERPGIPETFFRDYGIFGRTLISFTAADSFAGLPRLAGYAYEPSNYALVLLFGLTCGFTVFSKADTRRSRILVIGALSIIGINLFFGFSFGVFAAILIALLCAMAILPFHKRHRLMISFLLFLTIGFLVPLILMGAKDDLNQLFQRDTLSMSKGETLEIKILRQAVMWEMDLKWFPEGTDSEWEYVEQNTSPVNFFATMYVWLGLIGMFPFLLTDYLWLRGAMAALRSHEVLACVLAFSSIHFLSVSSWGLALGAVQMFVLWQYHRRGASSSGWMSPAAGRGPLAVCVG